MILEKARDKMEKVPSEGGGIGSLFIKNRIPRDSKRQGAQQCQFQKDTPPDSNSKVDIPS